MKVTLENCLLDDLRPPELQTEEERDEMAETSVDLEPSTDEQRVRRYYTYYRHNVFA